jgi:folate-binding protein YgfZ
MSEVVIEQVELRRLPLDELHRGLGASMMERDRWFVPATYSDERAEYSIVREGGAGLFDLTMRGRIEVSGTEAAQFLNGLITNDIKTLEDNSWMMAAFPNVQGRLIAAARILHQHNSYLFDTEAATSERVYQNLERFTLAGDFRIRDLTNETVLLSVQGARAAEIVAATLNQEASRTEHGRIARVEWKGESVMLIRATHTAEDGFDVFVDAGRARELWETLMENGARPVGFDAQERLRVEAGIPRYGVDMDESRIVLEAGLDEAVSYTKGCYVGQEIIARIHWRGHVAKRLAGITLDDAGEIEVGDTVRASDGREIGHITSRVVSFKLNKTVALAYVKYDYLAPGTEVEIVGGDTAHGARIVELPFVRGSFGKAA